MGFILIGFGLLMIAVVLYAYFTIHWQKPQSAEERKKEIYDKKVSTDINPIAARVQTAASKARTDLINQINIEADAYSVKNTKDIQTKLEVVRAETELIQHATAQRELVNRQTAIYFANEKGWDIATYLEMERLAESNRLELDKQWKQAEISLKGGFIFQMQAHQHLLLMTDYINGLYEKSRQLENAGKDREHKLIEEHIEFMEEDFRGRQRLLQTSEQKNLSGSNEDTDLR